VFARISTDLYRRSTRIEWMLQRLQQLFGDIARGFDGAAGYRERVLVSIESADTLNQCRLESLRACNLEIVLPTPVAA
jgi:hypothetical protein